MIKEVSQGRATANPWVKKIRIGARAREPIGEKGAYPDTL
jgi:hypothetical protein